MATPRFSLYVKKSMLEDAVGDCPFSVRAFAVAKKKIENFDSNMRVVLIDLSNKPPEYLAINPDGKVPFLIDHSADVKIGDSGSIVEYIDKLYPLPDMKVGHSGMAVTVAANVFGKFHKYMTCKDESKLDELKDGVVEELGRIDEYLQSRAAEGKFLLCDYVCDVDCSLYPKLRHIVAAGKRYRDFVIPEKMEALLGYYDCCGKTGLCDFMTDEMIIQGWARHM